MRQHLSLRRTSRWPTLDGVEPPARGRTELVQTEDLAAVRRTLWAAADQLRANSTLAPNEYRGPVLGLIFLAYAEYRFEQVRPEVDANATARRPVTPDDYRAR